jgi:membrane protease YdiL (CAAX protease family)
MGVSIGRFVNFVLASELLLVLLSYYPFYYYFQVPTASHLKPSLSFIALGILAVVPLVLFSIIIWLDRGKRLPWLFRLFRDIVEDLRPALETTIKSMGWKEIITISAAAGLGEEIMFRGIIQHWIGVVPAAIVFGLLHAHSIGYFATATLLGIYLGWLYQLADNLWPPILVHALYDVAAFYMLRKIYSA